MADKIKIGAVSYLNTKPLIYGFEEGLLSNEVEISFDYPAIIAEKLKNNEIDIGLVPVAVLPTLQHYNFFSNFCIGSKGAVDSVCLFADLPIDEVRTILLDYQSKTSVALLKILVKEYWKINIEFVSATENYENEIKGSTAGLVIGDRAFAQKNKNKYCYDLGEVWFNLTNLPFVFATWVSTINLNEEFIDMFNYANSIGLKKMDEVINKYESNYVNLKDYYTENILYDFNEHMKVGLNLFLQKIANHKL